MPSTDACGLDLTLDDRAARTAWTGAVRGFLRHGCETPTHLGATLEAAPHFAMGWAAKGLMSLLLGRRELTAVAHEAHGRALDALAEVGGTARERAYVAALGDWLAGRPGRSADRMAGILASHPEDALAMKLDQAIRFMLGDRRGMEAGMRRSIHAYAGDHPFAGYALGCLAFALEENGAYADAERAGLDALERAPDDVWGLHAVAHVHDMQGRAAEGIAWLSGREAQWAHCNNFGYHVWWHLGLFHLDRGDYDAVLALYDARVRPERTDDYRDVANGASMLTRLELEGIDVGERWEELAGFAAGRVEDGSVVFADLHYLLALHGADRTAEADRLVARIAADAQRSDHDMHEVAAVAGDPAARGLAAFRAGHYGLAFESLRAVRRPMQRIGGSHAQRDVFSRLMIEAAIRAGRLDDAEREVRERAARRGAEDGFTHRRLSAISAARSRAAELVAVPAP